MIILEDKEIERALFENREQALVPIEITERDGELEIITFEKTKGIAIELEKRYSSAPFSDEAVSFIHESLKDEVKAWGYAVDDINEGHIITFVYNQLKESLILPNTKMIKSSKGYKNLTDYELEDLPSDGDECYFVTIEEEKIVSVCEMNTEGAFIGATEINTYTAPEYRGRGYSASNVSAMCKYLMERGKKIAYTAHRDNLASLSIAKRCGFEKIAQTYYYICYNDEN